MAKTFYTERDIEDLYARGVSSLAINDDIVVTDQARERAVKLGMELTRGDGDEKPSSAPQRPYIAKQVTPKPASASSKPAGSSDMHKRVVDAVSARLGGTVDPKLLDTIVKRVLQTVGDK